MNVDVRVLVFLLVAVCNVIKCVNISSSDIESLRTTPTTSSKLQGNISDLNTKLDYLKHSAVLPMSRNETTVETARGFAVNSERLDVHKTTKLESDGWSPYHFPKTKGTERKAADSISQMNYKLQKKTDNRQGYVHDDFQFSGYTPGYPDMALMMQYLEKMDGMNPTQGFTSSILDNPIVLVMATFIPISLLMALLMPVIANSMRNGIIIPPIMLANSAKARGLSELTTIDVKNPLFQNLTKFGAMYLDNPNCLHRIFCEMVNENSTESIYPNYIRRAFEATVNLATGEQLNNFSENDYIETIKSGKCQDLLCDSIDKRQTGNILQFIENILFHHAQKRKRKSN